MFCVSFVDDEVTFKINPALLVFPSLEPIIVIKFSPAEVEAEVVIESCEANGGFPVEEPIEQIAPVGQPVCDKETG